MANDNELISRVRAGDEQAFAELIQTYYAYVYAIVIGIVNNPHDAEEVVQDTFVNAYRGLAQYEERKKFKSWLAEIARNCARNRVRKQQMDTVPIHEVNEQISDTEDLPDEQLIRNEQRENSFAVPWRRYRRKIGRLCTHTILTGRVTMN